MSSSAGSKLRAFLNNPVIAVVQASSILHCINEYAFGITTVSEHNTTMDTRPLVSTSSLASPHILIKLQQACGSMYCTLGDLSPADQGVLSLEFSALSVLQRLVVVNSCLCGFLKPAISGPELRILEFYCCSPGFGAEEVL